MLSVAELDKGFVAQGHSNINDTFKPENCRQVYYWLYQIFMKVRGAAADGPGGGADQLIDQLIARDST